MTTTYDFTTVRIHDEIIVRDQHNSRTMQLIQLANKLCVPVDRFFSYKGNICNTFFDGDESDMYWTYGNSYSPIVFEIVDAINQSYVTNTFDDLQKNVQFWISHIDQYTSTEKSLIASAWLFTLENNRKRTQQQVKITPDAIRINHSHGVYDCPFWLIKDAGSPEKVWDRLLKNFVWSNNEIRKAFIMQTYASACFK